MIQLQNFALLLIPFVLSLTINPNEKITHFGRRWSSKTPDVLGMYEKSEIGAKVFPAFGKALNPILEEVLAKREDLKKLREEGKIEITHHMLPMRDGVKLSTIVINPHPFDEKKGTMISRSPYGPTSDQIADLFILMNGFAAVVQDQRGTFLSEGVFSMWHQDAEDGFDTLAWIEQQPWSNGRVFSSGISADGCGTAAMILSRPPQLKGQLIMWASMDGHETSFPGGVFREGLLTGWMTMMAPLTRGKSLTDTLPAVIQNEALSEWWSPIQGPGHYHQAHWPTIHITAWWDIFQGHHLQMFNGISQYSSLHEHYLFVGPLGHCLLGLADPKISDPFLAVQEAKGVVNAFKFASEIFGGLPFEKSVLASQKKIKKVNLFVQGSRKEGKVGEPKIANYWTSLDNWPEPSVHRLLLGSDGTLSFEAPELESPKNLRKRQQKSGYAEFSYNPLIPMITRGGNNLVLIFLGMGCGSEDQRQLESRGDVLVFTTKEAFESPLAIMGNLKATLYVSTDRPDTDFYVSVTDVHPDGSSMQIRYGTRRMKWRESTAFRSVLTETKPHVVYQLHIDLWFTSYVLAPGHKLRVLISSANTPYYAKNDNSGEDTLGFKHQLPATNRVYWSQEYPSRIELPIVPIESLPENTDF